MEDLLKVGVITTTHGIRGEVKVYPTTDADRFLDLEYVLLDTGREKRKLEIENVKYFKNLVILKFRGLFLLCPYKPGNVSSIPADFLMLPAYLQSLSAASL